MAWPRPFKAIEYQGHVFPSHVRLAAHLRVDPRRLAGRIYAGWPQERWGEPARSLKLAGRGPRIYVPYKGRQRLQFQVARNLGISANALAQRKRRHPEDSSKWFKRSTYGRLKKIARASGVPYATVKSRQYKLHWPLERLGEPVAPRGRGGIDEHDD